VIAVPRLSGNAAGALWMLASVVGATAMTVLVREIAPEIGSAMTAFLRSAAALLFLAPVLARRRSDVTRLRFGQPGLHLARGALVAAALDLGFYAIWKLPLAMATILFFLAPLFATLFAPLIVAERLSGRRLAAAATGFAGAWVVLRPGLAPLDDGVAAALLSSVAFAAALLIGKRAAAADGPDAVFLSTGVLSALFTLPLALTDWRLPGAAAAWGLVMALAAASSLRGYADIRAYAAGESGFVSVFSYLRLPAAAAAGWLLYGERIDAATLLGGAIIAAAALDIAIVEARRGRPGAPAP
jgi:drug/metabolite transporter (DMT)-like permease